MYLKCLDVYAVTRDRNTDEDELERNIWYIKRDSGRKSCFPVSLVWETGRVELGSLCM